MTERVATCACEPRRVSLCHCLECQKRTGSTYGIAAFMPRGAAQIAGNASTCTRASDRGLPVAHHFCPACGSTVYWEPQRMRALFAVAVGAFADPSFPAPTGRSLTNGATSGWRCRIWPNRTGGEFAALPCRL